MLGLKITVEVEGEEGLDAVLHYKNTSIETIRRVENKILKGLIELNEEDSK